MSQKEQDFRNQYKVHPDRIKAISVFKKASSISNKKEVRKYMYQFMSTLGLELENRFPDYASFDDDGFKLFGREKSEKSIEQKEKHNIEDFDRDFETAFESGNKSNAPTEVRPIFDLFAFKLVCPESKDSNSIINIVLMDILNDIESNHPDQTSYIGILKTKINSSRDDIIKYINENFSQTYPELKTKIDLIIKEQANADMIQEFLDNSSCDISTLTYSQYSYLIKDCYQKLIHLAYEESFEEYVRILQTVEEALDEFSEYSEYDAIISEEHIDVFKQRLDDLLEHISRKKTNKLDLCVGDLMVFDILTTSRSIKKLGVTYSKDPSRTKHKRNPNGYIAEFYSLDMPYGLTSEIQLQSRYRYTYGESGPAAHSKMANGEKKRTLFDLPEDKLKYKKWAEKQFKALPRYFRYLGSGFVQIYNTLQNFRRYYDSENPEQVQAYVKFIAEHDIDQLTPSVEHFSIDDALNFRIDSLGINNENTIQNR